MGGSVLTMDDVLRFYTPDIFAGSCKSTSTAAPSHKNVDPPRTAPEWEGGDPLDLLLPPLIILDGLAITPALR